MSQLPNNLVEKLLLCDGYKDHRAVRKQRNAFMDGARAMWSTLLGKTTEFDEQAALAEYDIAHEVDPDKMEHMLERRAFIDGCRFQHWKDSVHVAACRSVEYCDFLHTISSIHWLDSIREVRKELKAILDIFGNPEHPYISKLESYKAEVEALRAAISEHGLYNSGVKTTTADEIAYARTVRRWKWGKSTRHAVETAIDKSKDPEAKWE